ncbi:MAG: triose-phosphate isomerase [Crocinitomicaceae bacterium]|nr:triose-phosphate isomerase [Crocinitomicaceae bacterium]
MRKKILAANWKMNLTQQQVTNWFGEFNDLNWKSPHTELRIYPSSIYLKELVSSGVHTGAQNVYFEASGAYTGELSIEQLQSIGAQSVLIGHSERRQLFNEDDALLAQKVNACATASFPFVLCCGEVIDTRTACAHIEFVLAQLSENLQRLSATDLHLLVVAYEPIWAIGSGLSADLEQITEMHQAIRNHLVGLYGAAGEQVPILYGGSVNAANAQAIFSCPNVDGALVGGASLDPLIFNQLWQALQA